ncbi:hypothetical protein CsSME_00046545 [Camellia sinensis var. sinensis]
MNHFAILYSVIHLGIAISKFDFEHRSVIHLRGFGTLRLLQSEIIGHIGNRIQPVRYDGQHHHSIQAEPAYLQPNSQKYK